MNPSNDASNRRLAKNMVMLYVCMFLTMIVGLYASRAVLAVLGVENFDVYVVFGDIVDRFHEPCRNGCQDCLTFFSEH